MGVASGCGEQEVGVASGSGWNVWVWLVGVVVRRYRFPHTTYPYSSCICSFYSSIPTFLFIFNMFFVLVPVLFLMTFYVLNNFFAQYKHTYRQLRASHGIHMKAAHTVLYMPSTHKRTLLILRWTSAV